MGDRGSILFFYKGWIIFYKAKDESLPSKMLIQSINKHAKPKDDSSLYEIKCLLSLSISMLNQKMIHRYMK